MPRFPFLPFLTLLFFLLAACQPNEVDSPTAVSPLTELPTLAAPPAVLEQAQEVAVLLQEVTVNIDTEGVTAVVRGVADDACVIFEASEQSRAGTEVQLTLTAVRTQPIPCPSDQIDQPFTTHIPLATLDWPDGFYVLTVNDTISTAFPYQTSMLAGFDYEYDGPVLEGFLLLEGRVWHDLCTGEADDAQCVNGRGDGLYTPNEPSMGQVVINLNRGACPGTGTLFTTRTRPDGTFRLAGLAPGVYCVALTAVQGSNRLLLQPGVWTASPGYLSDNEVYVNIDQSRDDLYFGWDYANLPRTAADNACLNQALLVASLNYADGVTLVPGQRVTKRWEVLNSGTCTWTTSYTAVNNSNGNWIALPQRTLPGETVIIEVPLVAPEQPGTYVSRWLLQNESGEPFGIGITGTGALLAEMRVSEGE